MAHLPKGSLSQRPKCPTSPSPTTQVLIALRAGGGGAKGRGVPCTYLSPLPHSPQDLLYFYRGTPPNNSFSWLIKSSDWCCVPSLWPLSGGKGDCRGKSWRGQSGTQGLSMGIQGPAGGRLTGEGPWVPRLDRRANVSCLSDSPGFPDLFLLLLCTPSPKGSTSKLQTRLLSDSVPPLHFQVPPGLLGPALQNPVPQTPALG